MSDAISKRSSRPLDAILQHVKENDDSALVIRNDGRFGNDITMAFSSGMWRAVKSEKPAEDITSNRASLNNLVDMLTAKNVENAEKAKNAGKAQGAGLPADLNKLKEAEKDKILRSSTQLPGDSRPYTVKERIERGTYVSSALVKQIAGNATRFDAETHKNLEVFKPVNQLQVSRFFGREPKDSESLLARFFNFLSTVQKAPANFLAQITNSPRISPYRAMILELQQKGTPDFPASRTEFWQAFADEMLKHDGAGTAHRKLFESLEVTLGSRAVNAAAKGRILSEDDIKKVAVEFVTNKFLMGQFVELVNNAKVEKLGQPEISDAIRAWKDAVAPDESKGIDQADCDWLAHELEVAIDAKRYIEQPGSGVREGFRDFIMGKNDDRDPFALVGKLIDEVADNHAKNAPPLNMTVKQRFDYYQQKNKDPRELDAFAGVHDMYSPKEYTSKDIARMMGGDRIKPLLREHHERMEKQNAPELNAVRESQRNVTGALQPFRVLTAQFEGLARNHDMTIETNKPQTAKDFVLGQLGPLIENARTERARNSPAMKAMEARLPPVPGVDASKTEQTKYTQAYREYSERLVATANMQVGGGAEEQILTEILPVLDRYTEFHKEVAALPRTADGRISAPPEKLEQLDRASRDLIGSADELFHHVHNLELKFSDDATHAKVRRDLTANNESVLDALRKRAPGTPKTSAEIELRGMTFGLREATKEIFLGARAYQRDSGADARRMAALEGDMKQTVASLEAGLTALAEPGTGRSVSGAESVARTVDKPKSPGTQQAGVKTPGPNASSEHRVSTNPFDPPTAETSTNPFDPNYVDPDSPASTTRTVERSTNPFENYVPPGSPAPTRQPTPRAGATSARSTTPLDNLGRTRPPPTAQSTAPSSAASGTTGTTRSSTNPFDDLEPTGSPPTRQPTPEAGVKPARSTNPFAPENLTLGASATLTPSTNPFDNLGRTIPPPTAKPAAPSSAASGTAGTKTPSTNPFDP